MEVHNAAFRFPRYTIDFRDASWLRYWYCLDALLVPCRRPIVSKRHRFKNDFGVDSFPLLALPLFMLAGELMKYGTTPRLMRLANALFGFMRGGLAGVAVASTAFLVLYLGQVLPPWLQLVQSSSRK